jgi:hypothetical protein
MARPQKGAEAQHQTIFFIDESGFYPLPSVVRTYAPIGQTPVLRANHVRALFTSAGNEADRVGPT